MYKLVGAALAAIVVPSMAQAVNYNALGDFAVSGSTTPWSYGSGKGGKSFSAFTGSHSGCFGNAAIDCRTVGGDSDVGAVGRYTGTGSTTVATTVTVPDDALWMHPSNGGGASDAVVRFTAPTSGSYTFDGLFERLSNAAANGGGNGVTVGIYKGFTSIWESSALAGGGLAAYPNVITDFSTLPSVNLNKGDSVSFVVGNNGDYQFDSTGLKAAVSSVKHGAIYDAAMDYASGNPSASAWSYGTGSGATNFSAFPGVFDSNCFGTAAFACSTISGSSTVAGVGRNLGTGDVTVATTVTLPLSTLWMHPSDGVGNTDSVVRFTTPGTGNYKISGLFSRLSNAQGNGMGDGVNVAIYNGATQIFSSSALASPNALTAYPSLSTAFDMGAAIHLTKGSVLSFVVNNNGTYNYDSTGLRASIAAVPEPSSWALMLVGFGALGVTARRRRGIARVA